MFNRKQIILLIASLVSTVLFAQEREQDTLNPDVINVIKPYTPTISDAFKVKESPTLDDDETLAKKDINYNIFSFPVASTFTPAKGKAAVVDKAKKMKLYDNYATLGVGSYTTVLGEVYLNHELGRGESVSAHLGHHSSQGGIDNVFVDDDFSDSKLNLAYSKRDKNMSWMLNGGFQLQKFNWYGLPSYLVGTSTIPTETVNGLDVGHTFTNAHIGGDISFEDSYFKSANVLFRRFGDNQGSGENRFVLKGVADIPIKDESLLTAVTLDYLGGGFDRNYFTDTELNYSNFQLAVSPTYELKEDDLTVNLGATLTYLNDGEAGANKFYIYPNISASYRLLEETVIAFGSVKGGLIQNSYYDYASENAFVSPTLFIVPTDQQYNATVGFRGKLSNALSYVVSGSYKAERDKGLFQNNLVPYGFNSDEAYQYGNSFGIVYDDVNTFAIAGELKFDLNRNFTLGIKGEYFSYNTKGQEEAWNLPDIKASVFLDYQISQQWFAGANIFYVGERKDLIGFNTVTNTTLPTFLNPTETVTLGAFLDVNAHLGYHLNERWSVYLKGNNLAEGTYNKWLNTRVQSVQVLAGATYKFDF
ncbi:TonB-dependent receptor [uncultured Lacinutrix sp.]|uniref:TonB-dependent receptor n=1 Tax=uncultured Lacinutrix sp. TaxID=574032 RepID=UPI002629686C|nr:TonB-dependent receptor [uncultured Lacinutrix sp.]